MRHSGNQRNETPPLLRLGSGEGKSTHGAPVKCSEEGDDLLPAGVVSGQFQGALDGFSPGVAVIETVGSRHRRDGREAFGQRHHVFVVEVGAGDVNQFRGLLLDGGDYLRMAMPCRNHGDPGSEVQELVSVDIFDAQSTAALGHHGIGAGIAGGHVALVARDDRAGFRARHRTKEFRTVLSNKCAVHMTIVLHSAFSAFLASSSAPCLKASKRPSPMEYRADGGRAELRRWKS